MIEAIYPGENGRTTATLDEINLEEVTFNDVINGLENEKKISTTGMTYFMLDPVSNQPVDKNVSLASLGVKEGDTIEIFGKAMAA